MQPNSSSSSPHPEREAVQSFAQQTPFPVARSRAGCGRPRMWSLELRAFGALKDLRVFGAFGYRPSGVINPKP